MGSSVGGSLDSRHEDARLPVSREVRTRRGSEREKQAKAESLMARVVGVLRANLLGHPGIVSRSANTWLLILRGERTATVQDIVDIAQHPSKEARATITELCGLLLAAVRPTDGTLIGRAIADFTREAAEVAARYADDLDDGTLTATECDELQKELADVARESARLSVALEAHRRRLA